jgi:hypothetical protein
MPEQNLTILIVDNHSRCGQLYSVSLEAYIGATVVEFSVIDEAIDFLASNTPRIIITRGLFDQRDAGAKFAQIIEQRNLKVHLIVIGQTKVSIHQANVFDENVDVRDIIKKCASLVGVTAKEMSEKDVGEYYPIRLTLLCPNLSLVCPIFKKHEDGHYVKFLDAQSKIHPEILTILKSSGDKEIYVQSAYRLKFVNSIIVFLSEMMADDRLSLEDTILFSNDSYVIVRDLARKMMISSITIQATEVNINTMMSITNKIPKLNQFLKLTTSKVNLIFKHSLLTCFVASHVIDKMEWGTNDQKVKIAFVCFFANLLLEKDDHIFVHSQEHMDLMNIPDAERESIINHPINSAKLMSKYYTSLPFGVDTIVKQHHGNRYGKDFTLNSANISPLALIYMVSDEWVTLILKAEKNKMSLTQEESLSIVKNKFNGLPFQEIIKALGELTV